MTRADIEEIRGVAVSKGALDVLMEAGWVRMRGRRAPGRPITYGTSQEFLVHFGLDAIGDLPGLDELKGAGLFDGKLPPGFGVPLPDDDAGLADDEEPLEAAEDRRRFREDRARKRGPERGAVPLHRKVARSSRRLPKFNQLAPTDLSGGRLDCRNLHLALGLGVGDVDFLADLEAGQFHARGRPIGRAGVQGHRVFVVCRCS